MHESISAGELARDGAATPADAELLGQGLAMRDALLDELSAIAGVRVGCTVGPAARALHRPGVVAERAGPDEDPPGYLGRVSSDYDRVWVVAPETGGLLEAISRAVAPERWIGCAPAAIAIAASKRATRAHLAACGIAVPPAAAPEADRASAWVVKPDDGAGAVDTRRHGSRALAIADLHERLARGEPATMEAWVEGEPWSLSLLAGEAGVEVLAINRQAIEFAADGTIAYRGVEFDHQPRPGHDDRMVRLAERVHRALPGLRGYVGIDLVMPTNGQPVLIEVNPRMTCAFVGLSRRLGRPLAAEVLALHARRRGIPA